MRWTLVGDFPVKEASGQQGNRIIRTTTFHPRGPITPHHINFKTWTGLYFRGVSLEGEDDPGLSRNGLGLDGWLDMLEYDNGSVSVKDGAWLWKMRQDHDWLQRFRMFQAASRGSSSTHVPAALRAVLAVNTSCTLHRPHQAGVSSHQLPFQAVPEKSKRPGRSISN